MCVKMYSYWRKICSREEFYQSLHAPFAINAWKHRNTSFSSARRRESVWKDPTLQVQIHTPRPVPHYRHYIAGRNEVISNDTSNAE